MQQPDIVAVTEDAKIALAKYIAMVRGITRQHADTQSELVMLKSAASNNEMSLHTLELNLSNDKDAQSHINHIKEIVKKSNDNMSEKVKKFHDICDQASRHLELCFNFNNDLAALIRTLNTCVVKELPTMSVGIASDAGVSTAFGDFASWVTENKEINETQE